MIYFSVDIQITDRKKSIVKHILLSLLLLSLLLIPGYLCYTTFKLNSNTPQPTGEEDIDNNEQNTPEEKINEEPIEEEPPLEKDPYEEIFQKIEGEQSYIAVPTELDEENPPTLIIYSHGSNTSVTDDMKDSFMQDLRMYGEIFTEYNYIFAASNQHGVNWGNSASVQDTLNLKQWIEMNYQIKEKLFLLGFSMGGLPTLNFTTTYPEIVSKVALLAPTTKTSEWNQTRAKKVEDIDIKIWHGNKDVNVPYSSVQYFVNSMSNWGKEIRFITLEGKTHFDVDTEYAQDVLQFFNS